MTTYTESLDATAKSAQDAARAALASALAAQAAATGVTPPVDSAIAAAITGSAGTQAAGDARWTTQAAGDARYSKRADLVFSVRHEGAVGNGSTDDTTAVNAAIAKANVLGGIVYFPPGTYAVGTLTALGNGVEVRGAGPYASVIRTTSSTAHVFQADGGVGWKYLIAIRDLQIESLITRTAGSGIYFRRVEGYIIDNVRFIDPYNCVTIDTSTSGWISRIKIAHGTATLNRGLWFQSAIDSHLSDIVINGGTVTLGAGKAWLHFDSGCDTVDIRGLSAAASSGSGIVLYFTHSLGGASFAPRWIKVSNFYVEGSSAAVGGGSDGILIEDALSAYFNNGYAVTSYRGIYVSGGTDIRFNQVLILNSWLQGMVVSSGATTLKSVSVTDCTFDSNSQGLAGVAEHLFVGGVADQVTVRGCRFSNDILGSATKPSYAIGNGLPLAQNLRVTECQFTAASYLTGIIGGGTGIGGMRTRDNLGLNPRGVQGPPAVPATTVAYTNAYGADATVYVTGGTVTGVAVQGSTTGLTSGAFRVPVGETITLTYSSAPTWKWFVD